MSTHRLVLCSLLCSFLVLAACGDSGSPTCATESALQVHFSPDRDGDASPAARWVSFPFPSDHRRTAEGRLDLSDFPNPNSQDLVADYIDTIEEELSGFSTNGPVYLRFTGPIDTSTLPEDAGAYLASDAPMQLIDVTEASPEYGEVRPLRWEYTRHDGTFIAKDVLAVAPAWGFVLRENTTYALVVTRALKGEGGATLGQPSLLRRALGLPLGEHCGVPSAASNDAVLSTFAPLRTYLEVSGRDAESLVAATVFTTQSITDDLAKIYAQIQAAPAPAYDPNWRHPRDPATSAPVEGWFAEDAFLWQAPDVSAEFWIMEGQFTLPNYQAGNVPYSTRGGGLRYDANGAPVVQRQETVRFVLTLPKDGPAEGSCFPIVEYAHGTGGSAYSFITDGTAGRLAGRQVAGISIDQPLHGPRGMGEAFDVDLMSFNYLNPESARMNFRQSAVDTFALTRFVQHSLTVPADKSPTGETVCFDPARVSFFGHSHGGLSGAIAAAFDDNLRAYMLSGAGGGLSITIFEREDYDIAGLIAELLDLGEFESLSELHPVITLAQTIVDVTDPINYAPYWVHLTTHSDPKSVFASSGERDNQTPYRTASAMAVAARIPNTLPVKISIPEYGYIGMEPVDAEGVGFSSNIADGVTAGFMQFKNDGKDASHWLIFRRPEAIGAAMRFLQSASYEEAPVIARDPNSAAR